MNTSQLRKFGPRPQDGALTTKPCPACGISFEVGDYTTLIQLGPGDDEEEMRKCREGEPYLAVGVEVHYSCATGIKCCVQRESKVGENDAFLQE